jgi:hypothetical protein
MTCAYIDNMKSFTPISTVFAAFAVAALVSLTIAACSSPTEIDAGSSESASTSRNPYRRGASSYSGGYGGYYGGHDLADDRSDF